MEIYTTPNNMLRSGYGYNYNQVKSSVTTSHDNDTCGTCMGAVGYSFVPVHTINDIFSPHEGLACGTIFPELSKPFGVYGVEVE